MPTTTDDPVLQLWDRVRKPLALVATIAIVVNQIPKFRTGETVPVVTGILLIVFWTWMFFRRSVPRGDEADPEYWRSFGRREKRAWAFWFVVGTAWLVWARTQYSLHPIAYLSVAFPATIVFGGWYNESRAEKQAARFRKARDR